MTLLTKNNKYELLDTYYKSIFDDNKIIFGILSIFYVNLVGKSYNIGPYFCLIVSL